MIMDSRLAYFQQIQKFKILSGDENKLLVKEYQETNNNAIKDRVIEGNLRLVIKILSDYYIDSSTTEYLDVVQEGNIGLLHALKKYNPDKAEFSTYASFWIRSYILKYLMDTRSLIKIGTTQNQKKIFYSLTKEIEKLKSNGIEPTSEILAANLEVNVSDIEEMKTRLFLPIVHLGDLYESENSSENSNDKLWENILIDHDHDVEHEIMERDEKEILKGYVELFKKELGDKEKLVFNERICSDESKTLQSIGDKFNISRERVRQIDNKVRQKFDKFIQPRLKGERVMSKRLENVTLEEIEKSKLKGRALQVYTIMFIGINGEPPIPNGKDIATKLEVPNSTVYAAIADGKKKIEKYRRKAVMAAPKEATITNEVKINKETQETQKRFEQKEPTSGKIEPEKHLGVRAQQENDEQEKLKEQFDKEMKQLIKIKPLEFVVKCGTEEVFKISIIKGKLYDTIVSFLGI